MRIIFIIERYAVLKKILFSTLLLTIYTKTFAAEPSHCSADEQIIYSCSVGKKTASVCASKDAAKDKGYVQYKFGPIGKPEITFPDKKEPGNKNFSFVMELFAYQAGPRIIFTNGKFTYSLLSYSGRGDGGTVSVERSGKTIAEMQCKNPPDGIDDLKKIGLVDNSPKE